MDEARKKESHRRCTRFVRFFFFYIDSGNGSVVPCTISTAVVRVWKFRTSDHIVHSIMLRHDHVFGSRTVELDGRKVHYSCGDGDLDLSFNLCGQSGKLVIKTQLKGLTVLFTYTCFYADVEIPPTASSEGDKSTLDLYAVCIPKHKLVDEVIYYKIVSERSGSKCPSSVWRCYNDFSALHFDLSSAFTGTDLIGRLPDLPPDLATSVLFEPVEDEDVEQTRKGLESFLIRVKKLPKTGSNPDLLRFLGIRQFVHQNAKTATCPVNAMKILRTGEKMTDSFSNDIPRESFPVASIAESAKVKSVKKEKNNETKFTWNRKQGPSVVTYRAADATEPPAVTTAVSTRPLEEDENELIEDI